MTSSPSLAWQGPGSAAEHLGTGSSRHRGALSWGWWRLWAGCWPP